MDAGHDQNRAMLGAYALGALDEAEREQVDAHLRQCGACRTELARLVAAAEALNERNEEAPVELWERILARLRRRNHQ